MRPFVLNALTCHYCCVFVLRCLKCKMLNTKIMWFEKKPDDYKHPNHFNLFLPNPTPLLKSYNNGGTQKNKTALVMLVTVHHV